MNLGKIKVKAEDFWIINIKKLCLKKPKKED